VDAMAVLPQGNVIQNTELSNWTNASAFVLGFQNNLLQHCPSKIFLTHAPLLTMCLDKATIDFAGLLHALIGTLNQSSLLMSKSK
jgi:hypothetical protein